MHSPLSVTDVRVLGSLIEKQITTPDNYPLTLNALTAACNQTSNRDPVLSLQESEVRASLDVLDRRALVRAVHRSDSRVRRYRHLMEETLNLHPPEAAALCVLLLRGPQTSGEIRARTARLFAFTDTAHVDITLESLMTLSTPLVVQLPRRPGHKELRYAHLLSGEPVIEAEPRAQERAERPAPTSRIDIVEQDMAAVRAEVGELRAEVGELRALLDAFRRQFE
jgi:uncharacterized protein